MIHSFDVEIAKKYGVNCALLLNNLYYWIKKNEANNKHFHEGTYWTYNSKKAFAELFPYMNARQIDYAMKKLIDDDLVITGNFNENAYDRTLWYAITKKGYCILQNCEMEERKLLNGDNKIVKPIPNINNTNNKINNKENISNDIKEIVDYLNEKTQKHYQAKGSTYDIIKSRLNDGYTIDDCKYVIDVKSNQWLNTDMEKYLRPETLFNRTKFESYLNEETSKYGTGNYDVSGGYEEL